MGIKQDEVLHWCQWVLGDYETPLAHTPTLASVSFLASIHAVSARTAEKRLVLPSGGANYIRPYITVLSIIFKNQKGLWTCNGTRSSRKLYIPTCRYRFATHQTFEPERLTDDGYNRLTSSSFGDDKLC